MFFWTPDSIRLRSTTHTNHRHQTVIVVFTALAAIFFLLILLYGILASTTNGQIGRGLRKCRADEFVPDDSKPGNKGFQASVSILRDPLTNRKYFFKAHKSAHVFRQERKILYGLGNATPRAVCFTLKPEKGIVMELAGGGDLLSDSWYHPDNPLRFQTYPQLVTAVAHFVASLAAVHSRGYLHNDLRPNNVIFNHPHRLQVIDFGLSRRLGKKGFHTSCARNSPPETVRLVNRKDRYLRINSTASDWYTLGVLSHFFVAKGLFCMDNFHDEACAPGQQQMFWPYTSLQIQNDSVSFNWNPPPPVPLPADFSNFISKLIVIDPLQRDFRGPKLVQLLRHPIFAQIDWHQIDPNLSI